MTSPASAEQVAEYLRDNGLWPGRARYHGPVVRVELARSVMPKVLEEPYRSELEALAKQVGFTFVALDLTGLQSGSLSFALE